MSVAHLHYRWQIAPFDAARARALAAEVGLPPLIAHLLLLRGVETPDAMRDFLSPSLSHLSDPFAMTGMRAAVKRIMEARARDESVLVFGDYDVDGITAAAILTRGLRRFGLKHVDCDMPDRFSEGYGLTPERVERAHRDGFVLLITVDNGISAHAAAARARELGLDLIITDHHALDAELPDALAVINPKRDDPDLPTAHLSGAGVAFKLAAALNGAPHDLDIAALGAVADIVPLLQENRVIVALGIKHMKKHRRLGLARLAQVSRFDINEVNAQKIGFQLGPRLNAAGRIETGHAALELLMTDCEEQAAALARTLDKANEDRRAIEQHIYEQALEILDAFLKEEQRSIVLAADDWHQGVIGIVASRLQMRYHRPVVICCLGDDGLLHGSARSGPGFDMMAALAACDAHLRQYGGHRAAAGLTLEAARLDAFRECFEQDALRQLGAESIEPLLKIDALAALSQLDGAFMSALEHMAPFGQANPEPVFCAAGVDVAPQSMRVLKDQHLKFSVRQGKALFTAMGFRMAERYFTAPFPSKLDIVFTPQLNTYNNVTETQLVLKDMRPSHEHPE